MLSLVTKPSPRVERAAPDLVPVYQTGRVSRGLTDADAPTVDQQRLAYRGVLALCLRLRSRAVAEAMQKAVVERFTAPGVSEEVEPSSPWVRLLSDPSRAHSARYLWTWVQQAKDMGRGAFLVVVRDSRRVPVELVPVYPAFGQMLPVGDASGSIERWVYRRSDGREFGYDAADVIWVRHPHPVSPYESASIIEQAAYEADTDLYAHIYRRDLLKRGGNLKLQLTTDQELTEEQARSFGARANARIFDRDLVPVFGKGTSLKPVGLPPEDMEYVQAAGLTRTELFQIAGVPEGMVSDTANRANAEAARAVFADLTVQPEADDLCDTLTHALRLAFDVLPDSGLVIRAPHVVPLDLDYVLRRDESHLRSGLRTLNELRERDGEEPYGPEGDVPLVSAGLLPLAQAVAEPEPVPPALAAPAAPEGEDEPDEGGERGTRGATVTVDADTLTWQRADASRRRAEASIHEAARGVLRRMRDAALSALPSSRAAGDIPEGLTLLDIGVWVEEVASTLSGPIAAVLRSGWLHAADLTSYDGAFDATRPAVRRALAQIVDLQRSVPETVGGILQTQIADALRLGESVDQLASRIRTTFDGLEDWEAKRIAQTSSTAGFEAGQVENYREAGVERKRWLSQRDGRVRPEHAALDGEEVGVDEAFSNGLEHPGEPNCRCTLLPVIGERSAPGRGRPWRVARDREIARLYPALRDAEGAEKAREKLSKIYSVSDDTIRRAIGQK